MYQWIPLVQLYFLWIPVTGSFDLVIRSPAPGYLTGNGACEYNFDAIAGHPLSFDVIARSQEEVRMSMMVARNDDFYPVVGCPVQDCDTALSCGSVCSASSSVSEKEDGGIYTVSVSSADTSKGLRKVTVCVRVKNESDANLQFTSLPDASINVTSANLTLTYKATGYPLPVIYHLWCQGRPVMENAEGTFLLTELRSGQMNCTINISNSMFEVSGESTLLTVAADSANVVSDVGSGKSTDLSLLAQSVQTTTATPNAAQGTMIDAEGKQYSLVLGLSVGVVVVAVLAVSAVAAGLAMHKRKMKKQRGAAEITDCVVPHVCSIINNISNNVHVHGQFLIHDYDSQSPVIMLSSSSAGGLYDGDEYSAGYTSLPAAGHEELISTNDDSADGCLTLADGDPMSFDDLCETRSGATAPRESGNETLPNVTSPEDERETCPRILANE